MHKFYGGRGRTRTGTPVSQKQILSPSEPIFPMPLYGHGLHPESIKTLMPSAEMH
jgi:hypothetical protein